MLIEVVLHGAKLLSKEIDRKHATAFMNKEHVEDLNIKLATCDS